jgi:hypothetical protein
MTFFQSVAVAALVLLAAAWLHRQPDREELGWRSSLLRFTPVQLNGRGFGDLRLEGAWEVTSCDPRFGGVSALALTNDQLIALSDSGGVVRFAKPNGPQQRATIGELPGGPGAPGFKYNRDSEALVADPRGRGWWIAFENRDQLWLYDAALRRVVQRVTLSRFPQNRGIEGVAATGRSIAIAPEQGDSIIEWSAGNIRMLKIANPAGRISDMARLPSGELLVVNRRATRRGFANSVALLTRGANGYTYTDRMPLGTGKLDNVEAVASERLPNGRIRLWLMTDDNHQRPLRTLLIAVDLPARRRGR